MNKLVQSIFVMMVIAFVMIMTVIKINSSVMQAADITKDSDIRGIAQDKLDIVLMNLAEEEVDYDYRSMGVSKLRSLGINMGFKDPSTNPTDVSEASSKYESYIIRNMEDQMKAYIESSFLKEKGKIIATGQPIHFRVVDIDFKNPNISKVREIRNNKITNKNMKYDLENNTIRNPQYSDKEQALNSDEETIKGVLDENDMSKMESYKVKNNKTLIDKNGNKSRQYQDQYASNSYDTDKGDKPDSIWELHKSSNYGNKSGMNKNEDFTDSSHYNYKENKSAEFPYIDVKLEMSFHNPYENTNLWGDLERPTLEIQSRVEIRNRNIITTKR